MARLTAEAGSRSESESERALVIGIRPENFENRVFSNQDTR